MKLHVVATSLLLATSAPAAAEERALFDGRSLAGWEGATGLWTAEHGEIVGRTEGLKQNEFLCTRDAFADFTLTVTFRVIGDETKNSGVQFRTHRLPGSTEVAGYQADVGQGYWGALYDESRRKKVLVAPPADVVARAAHKDGWNTYVVHAQGPHVTLTLNGARTVDWVEPDATVERSGIVCLQMHAGHRLEVHFKDIRLGPP